MQSEKLKTETRVTELCDDRSRKREMAPRFTHVFLLMAGSCLPIMGTLLIAPILPEIQRSFSEVPGVEYLAPIALTIPALFVAILAPFAGAIVDALGRKRPLVIALALLANVAIMIGSRLFHRLNIIGFTTPRLLALSFACSGSGLLILTAATTMNGVTIGLLITGSEGDC